jgi:Ca2+-binding EF-hand superfamily protein
MIDQLGSNGEISLSQIENALGATSSSQIADLTQAFNQIDTNGDGELSQSELTAAITQQQQDQQASGVGGMHHHHHHGGGGQVTSTQMATDLIDQLDPSGNGSLSLSALETALGLPTPSGASGTANASSSAGGTDGSSSTSSTTSSGTGASNSTGLASLSNTVAQEFNSLDTNGDGQISVSELASAIQSFRQAMEASWSSAWSTNQAGFSTAA